MNRRYGVKSFPALDRRLGLPGVLLLALAGCLHEQVRPQSEDETERDRYHQVKTIGDVTNSVGNTDPIPIGGVGLVVGLNGTGSSPASGSERALLESTLLKQGETDVRKLLSSSDISMVRVSALVPPGAHKGDPLDVEITLPPGSRTTSLRSGKLYPCRLYNYDVTGHLDPSLAGKSGGDRNLVGHVLAIAEGPLLVGFDAGDEAVRVKQARIWGGARCKLDRPIFLVMNNEHQYVKDAALVADRINEMFHGRTLGGPSTEMAAARSKALVALNVPEQYRHNPEHFMRVVRLIPFSHGSGSGGLGAYRKKLADDLLDPAYAVTAALRLEALGKDSIPTLKQGLQSERPLVRFVSAESLAYMGDASAGQELGRAVADYPDLRAFGLTALASLDESVSRVQLRELLLSPDAEVRYGAFRALRALDETDPAVQGKLLNESFWLHRVATNTQPLVHFTTSKRPEVVLFGEDASLVPPFAICAGEFNIAAPAGDEQCTIGRYSTEYGVHRLQCSLRVEDIIQHLAAEGACYPEIVEMLRQASARGHVSCQVRNDALPQATSVYELAAVGRKPKDGRQIDTDIDPQLAQPETDIQKARGDFGATPSLFDLGGRRPRSAVERNEDAEQRDRKKRTED
jgi:flagellar basal body P-ring protein FlgI